MSFRRTSVVHCRQSSRVWLSFIVVFLMASSLPAQDNFLSLIQDKIRSGEVLSAALAMSLPTHILRKHQGMKAVYG